MPDPGKGSRPGKTLPPNPAAATTPEAYPTTSSQLPSGDYSYTLEVCMEMQKTLGQVTEAITALKGQSKTHGEQLGQVSRDIYAAKVVIGLVGGFVGIVGIFLGIVLKAIFDYILRTHVK
jgi:hypothetical protein